MAMDEAAKIGDEGDGNFKLAALRRRARERGGEEAGDYSQYEAAAATLLESRATTCTLGRFGCCSRS